VSESRFEVVLDELGFIAAHIKLPLNFHTSL